MGLSWKLSFIFCLFFYLIQILYLVFINFFGFASVILTLTPAILYALYCNFNFSKSILFLLVFLSFFDDLRLGIYLGTNLILYLIIILFIKLYLEKNFSWSKNLILIFSLVGYYLLLYVVISSVVNVFNIYVFLSIVIVNSSLNLFFFFVFQKFFKVMLVSKGEN